MAKSTSKYYELHKIPSYRYIVIDAAIKKFKNFFGIYNIPIDCIKIAKKLNKDRTSNIRFKSTLDLPAGILGRTIYLRDIDYFLVSINRSQLYDKYSKRTKYPFMFSSDRMLNFTIAHEFGHIYLNHAEIPDSYKSDKDKEEEHVEANEFAGRLLMPESKIVNCNFSAISDVAEQFLVSEQAVLKRLTHLGRHDIRKSKPLSCLNSNFKP